MAKTHPRGCVAPSSPSHPTSSPSLKSYGAHLQTLPRITHFSPSSRLLQSSPLGFGRAEIHKLTQVKRTRRGAHCKNFRKCLKYEKQSQQPDNLISWNGLWEKRARSWAPPPTLPHGPGTHQAAAFPWGSVLFESK